MIIRQRPLFQRKNNEEATSNPSNERKSVGAAWKNDSRTRLLGNAKKIAATTKNSTFQESERAEGKNNTVAEKKGKFGGEKRRKMKARR